MKRKSILKIVFCLICGVLSVNILGKSVETKAGATSIKIENANEPGTMNVGTSFSIAGQISAYKELNSVTAGIYDVNEKAKMEKKVTPKSCNYNVANIAQYLKFEKLPEGIYRYKLIAENVEGAETLVSRVFVVYGNSRPISDGKYRVRTQINQNYVLAVDDNSSEDSTNIELWMDEPANICMTWEFYYQGNGYYSIKNVGTEKFVDVYNANTESGTNVHQYHENGTIAQAWKIIPDRTGRYYLVPKVNHSLCMDVSTGNAENGLNIQVYTANMTKAQRWNLDFLGQKSQSIQAESKTVTYKSKAFYLNAKTTGNGKLSYSSSNKNIATVDTKGKVSIKGYGTATIYIKASETKQYKKASKKITITVIPRKMKIKAVNSPKKKYIKVSWEKDSSVTGYIMYISLNKNFKNQTFQRTYKKKVSSMNTSGLKSKRRYYIKIRAYKKIGKKKIYGNWSSAKSINIK